MSIHEDIRQALAGGITEDALLAATRRIADRQANGTETRPIVWHTLMTILEGVWRRWFADHSLVDDFPPALEAQVIPAIRGLLAADERSDSDAVLLSALDDAARAYIACVRSVSRGPIKPID